MHRRKFLRIGAAGLAGIATGIITWQPRAEAGTIRKTLYIVEGNGTPFIDNVPLYWRAFSANGYFSIQDIPGELITAQQGDTVEVTVVNTLNTDHSFVIDGVFDSGVIRGGNTGKFSFKVDKPGTYLYYDKLKAPYNRMVGLHGVMAVMPSGSSNELYSGSPRFNRQLYWVLNDVDPRWNDALARGQTPGSSYVPRYFSINGLAGRPPGAPGSGNGSIDSMHDPHSIIKGRVGTRHLLRIVNAGMCTHSIHFHANHVEWLTENNKQRPAIWLKDVIPIAGNKGQVDVIFPMDRPPDAWPAASKGHYPMHLHDEMSQTAAGGYYQFGAITEIIFE